MSKNVISVDIVSDVVCPWCIIGYKKLQKAINRLDDNVKVQFNWHPFELNPGMPPGGENLRQHLAAKYGTTPEGSIAARKRLTEIGAELGFSFNYFDEMRMYNTRKAHKLLHWSKQFGLQTELKMALFSGYFSEGKEMDSDDVLLQIAQSVGLSKEGAVDALADKETDDAITAIQGHWRSQGVQAVPAFIFEGQYLISGAQEVDAFEQVLRNVSIKLDATS